MKPPQKNHRYFSIAIWIFIYLIVIDAAVNIIFHYPDSPHTQPSTIQGYFDYGRSVEGKLAMMTRKSGEESSPRVRGGWLNSDRYNSLPNKTTKPDEVLVALYGMSHTKQLWKSISKTDKRYLIRGFMAAGATPNWSYAAYEFDKGRHQSDVAILGIMTDGIPLVTSTTGITAYFDINYPYTFPRYRVINKELIASYPPFLDEKGYLEYFNDQSKWSEYRSWLEKNDKYYDPILFKRSMIDHSAFIRLLRRGYSERERQKIISTISTNANFVEDSEEIVTLRAIVKAFAESAREENIIPIIYIVNTKGQGDYLFRVLKPVLDAHNIPHLSTHIICPPDDPRVYMATNSHFIPSKDMELASAMMEIIEKELGKNKKHDHEL